MTESARPALRHRGVPLVGATFSYFWDPLALMRRQYDAYGPVSELDFVSGTATVLLGPDACGAALQNRDKAFANWPQPEVFDPLRFASHRREDKVHRYAWEPFGGGVHKCLGMAFAGSEVKLIVHQLLRRIEWTVDAAYSDRLNYHSLPFPADGQPVALHRLERMPTP